MNNRDQHGSRAKGRQLRAGGDWSRWPQLLAGLLLVAGLSPFPLWAQTNAAKVAPLSRRWLFVVETSKVMQRRADGVLAAVRGLLASDLNGQLQAGDTLGMWTFNDDLYAGRLPLQTWSPQAREEIMERTVAFLKSQKYEKLAKFNKVAPALGRVIKDSELITVILISSGDGKIQGTTIDGGVNDYYNQWRKQQEKGRIPFVIVMRAQNGQVADYAFNTAPWPVQLPPLAPEMRSAEPAPERIAKAVPKISRPVVPPPVVSQQEAPSEPAPTPKAEPVPPKTESPPALGAAAITNETAKAKPPEPAAPPVEVVKTEPPPATVVATTTNEPVKAKPPEPTAPPVEAAKTDPPPAAVIAPTTNELAKAKPPEPTAPSVEVAKVEPPPQVPERTATEPVPKPAPTPTPVPQPKQETPIAPQVKPVEPAPAKPEAAPPPPTPTPKPESITVEPPKPAPAPLVTTVPTPTASPDHGAVPSAAPIAAATPPVLSATSTVAARPSSLPTPPVQNATAVPAETLTSHVGIWTVGLVLAVVAAVSAFLLMRRSHATPQGSLITRSYERDKKP